MMRRRLFVVSAVLALAVLAVAAWVLFQDPDRYRDEVAALLGDAAGHPVTLGGPLELSWRPSPTLSVTGVGVDAGSARVTIDSVQVRVEPAALLSRRFRAREVRMTGVAIDLVGEAAPGSAPVLPDPASVRVDHLLVDDITLTRDGRALVRIRRLELREPDSERGARLDIAMPAPGGEIAGKVRVRVSGDRVRLSELALHTPAGPVEGVLAIVLSGARPRVEGELSADAIALGPARTAAPASTRVFPRRPLDLSPLEALDASVRVRIGRLSLGGVRLSDVTVPLTLSEGRLASNATATLAAGVMNAVFDADARSNDWTLRLDLTQADAGDALGMLGVTQAEKGGRMDLRADLRAGGADTLALLSSLSGEIRVDASQLHIRAGAARLAGSDVLATVTRMLRGSDGERISVECAVARVAVRDGVVSTDEGIGVQTRTMNVLGSGRISLPDEQIELVFKPWAREGLGLSASSVVGAVGVTGTLADPRVGLTSEAALRGGATAGAALLTGGLSLIAQGLLDRTRGDAPCQTAAGRQPGGTNPRSSGGALDTAKRASDQVGDAVKEVGETLKGLFGGSRPGGGAKRGGSEQ